MPWTMPVNMEVSWKCGGSGLSLAASPCLRAVNGGRMALGHGVGRRAVQSATSRACKDRTESAKGDRITHAQGPQEPAPVAGDARGIDAVGGPQLCWITSDSLLRNGAPR